ncbi:peptidase S9 prolyl oligopeptidase active site domain protein [Nitratireductor indicus C115]|uniref:Peptidase S9 prolyl oligopeptidase active site domain protein n=2 Tax=Nitratireductor indicus TaxID=721133 RepID=K2N732_9HYPH|nr:peptidase S9 prolyl oligopeptidase active site domain protein [Nitratireductor indicus C115]SFQ54413.1 Dipeptidyl aminopeptidase/acylaminoacyl peptidase [Nitratireductor indicus]
MKMKSIVVAALVSAALASMGGYLAIQFRTIAPTHKALNGNALQPLIPVRAFYANLGDNWNYSPSHDGSMIAWYAYSWAQKVINIRRKDEDAPFIVIPAQNIDLFTWSAYDQTLLVHMDGRQWRVDPMNPEREEWVDVTPRGFNHSWAITTPRSPEELVVVSSSDRNPAFSDLYTVRQDGGGKQLLAQNTGNILQWWLDANNVPILRLDREEDGASQLMTRSSNEDSWRPLIKIDRRDNFTPIGVPRPGEAFYAASDRGRDRLALVSVDPQSGTETEIVASSSETLTGAWLFNPWEHRPDMLLMGDAGTSFVPLTQNGETARQLLTKDAGSVAAEFANYAAQGRFVVVARSLQTQPYENFLYDFQRKTATKLGENPLAAYANDLPRKVSLSFKARDGMDIPAYLVLPTGVRAFSLPAVVMIHGGPAERFEPGFDVESAFLANRGYAVLQVDFRGSTGHGRAHQEAGYRQVGKTMQDDIVDAAHWLIEEGIADPKAIAVMGGSYGGYSAALAMTRDPGLFKAAIVESAVLDVPYQMQNNPYAWGLNRDEAERYFGNPENPADLKAMEAVSPQTQVDKVQDAILLLAGKEDPVVGFEQSEEFARSLKAGGKSVEAVFFEGEGHTISSLPNRITRARLIEDFLAEHLGGRSSGFDLAEWYGRWIE